MCLPDFVPNSLIIINKLFLSNPFLRYITKYYQIGSLFPVFFSLSLSLFSCIFLDNVCNLFRLVSHSRSGLCILVVLSDHDFGFLSLAVWHSFYMDVTSRFMCDPVLCLVAGKTLDIMNENDFWLLMICATLVSKKIL